MQEMPNLEYEVTVIIVARQTGQKFQLTKTYEAVDQFDALGKAQFDISKTGIDDLCDVVHSSVGLQTEVLH